MSDQHNPHVLGCAGDLVVRTPHLDRLAGRGVRFTNTTCGSPLCVPSRMTFLTSRHCSDIDVWSNSCTLDSEIPTFAHSLNAAGYRTVLCGRMNFSGPDQRHGFQARLIGDVTQVRQFPGPDRNVMHPIPRGTVGQNKAAVEVAGPGRTAFQAYDDAVIDACCRFLAEGDSASESQPFAVVVGAILPHCPFICPPDLYRYYHDRIDVPRLPSGYLDRLHPAALAYRQRRQFDDLTDEQVRAARAAYYGLVEYTDRLVGRVLETLANTRYGENTLIVYTSDHGDMAGEHRIWTKSNFYEGSVGVPMIWSWPGHFAQGRVIDRVTSLLDVGPTLLDLLDASPLPGAAGRSLAGFLSGPGLIPDWPDEAFSEYCGLLGDRPGRMLRSGPYKLNHYHGYAQPQLFNLGQDPDELHDLRDDPAHAEVLRQFHRRVLDGWDGDRIERAMADLDARRREAHARAERFRTPEQDFWDMPPDCNVFPMA
jgi:choline-sulfatase